MRTRGGYETSLFALACAMLMMAVPLSVMADSISGTVLREEVGGKTNTIGEADLSLYNYAGVDTSGTAQVVESGNLLETERWVELPGKSTETPVNATVPWTLFNANDSVAGMAPGDVVTNVVSQVKNGDFVGSKTWTGGVDPTGQEVDAGLKAFDPGLNIVIGGNSNDSLPVMTQPSGTPAVQMRTNDSLPSLELPSGTVAVIPVTDDSVQTLVQPTGAQGINTLRSNATSGMAKPLGLLDNAINDYAGAATSVAPAGNYSITPQTVNLSAVVVAPVGVPASLSGTYYVGNFTVDGNETGEADTLVFLVLIDTTIAGTYDNMAISINDIVFNEGALNDGIVDHGSPPGGGTNDELINGPAQVVLGLSPLFEVSFDPDPTVDDNDAWIRTLEWHTGNFLMDADSDGAVDDTIYYSTFDHNSDGVFDSADLSLGDNTFGQGDIEDGDILTGNDEALVNLGGATTMYGPDDFGYTWSDTAEFDWIEISGSGTNASLTDDDHLSVDLGFDFVYYGDTFNNTTICSNGYIIFNETDQADLDWIYWNFWEDVPMVDGVEGPVCPLCDDNDPSSGGSIYYKSFGTAPNRYFVVEYDDVTDWDTESNNRTAQVILYENTNLIKMQWADIGTGLNVIGIEHNNESTGIGTNAQGDLYINASNITNGTAFDFYPPGAVGGSSVTIGDYKFKFMVSATPALSATDINITSVDWYTGAIDFDASECGQACDNVFYAIADTNSDGIFDQVDLTLNGTFGGGDLGDKILNDTDAENYAFVAMPDTITIGPTLLFGIDFDRFPAADNDDFRLTASSWFEGSFVVDADDDSVADDTIYYVLSDSNSDGAFDMIDLSMGDQTFGEGSLADGNVSGTGDDERFPWSGDIVLGSTIKFTVRTSGKPTNGLQDMMVHNRYSFKGNLTFDTDSDGQADDDLYFTISDGDSDGIYDTLDLSFDPLFGEGNLNDGLLTLDPFNDERLTGDGDVQLGKDMNYNISFDIDPQNDNEDLRLTVKVWFKGTFVIDADNDGSAVENVHYVLTDSDSNGFFDTMDLSLGNEVFGEGNLGDATLVSGNDERITQDKTITIGTTLRFLATFQGSPGGLNKDATLKNSDLYTGTLMVDLGIDGVADDTVNFAISDVDSDGLYDTIDLSLANEVYREDLPLDGYVDTDNNDERMSTSGLVRIGAFHYDLAYVPNPHVASIDVVLTTQQWYLGSFLIDADADGEVNETINFLISDLDSNGVYDNMDLSLGDLSFDEGDMADGVLSSDGDEYLKTQGDVELGDLILNFRFTPSPNQNIEDAWLKNTRWYTGTITGSDWTVGYAICDIDSNGVYDTVEMSDDAEFGEGDNNDNYLRSDDDEVSTDGDMLIRSGWHFKVFVNGSMAGIEDVGLKSLEWRTGRWSVEGVTRSVAVSDSNSDGVMDSIHLDMNDDGSFNSPQDIMGGIEGFRGSLVMTYVVASSNPDGTSVEIVPQNGSTGDTDSWMVGYVRAEGIDVALALSDANDDNHFDTVDIDTTGDGRIDNAGLQEANDVYGTIVDVDHQVISISPTGERVRLVGFTGAIVGSTMDRSVTNTLKYGSTTEGAVGADMNGDDDMDDALNVVVVDVDTTGHITKKLAIYVDVDLEDDLTNDEPYSLGVSFDMGDSKWKVDHVTTNRNEVGLKKITRPSATVKTGPDGKFVLTPPNQGTYWIKVASSYEEWGYETFEDTNDHAGYSVSSAGLTDKDLTLVQSGGSIAGQVTDMITGDPLGGVTVEVLNMDGDKVISTLTLSDGTYLLGIGYNKVIDITFSKTGYLPDDGTRSNGTWHGLAVGAGKTHVDVSLMPDPAPEIMSFIEPVSGEVLTGEVTVTVEVTETVVVDVVKLTVNNGISWFDMNDIGSRRYSAQWDTSSNPDGTYVVIARATNDVGLRADSYLDVIVDNGGPVVVFKSAGEQYGNVELTVRAEDEFSDVDKLEISIDDGPWQRMSKQGKEHYFMWSSGPLDSGTHKYSVKATDSRGNEAIYESSVEVDNTWMLLLIVAIIVGILVGIVIMKKRGAGKDESEGRAEAPPQTGPPPPTGPEMAGPPPQGPVPGPEGPPVEEPAMPGTDIPQEGGQ